MKLLFGCGYLGSRVARRWLSSCEAVTIVTRTAAKAAELRAAGYETLVADVNDSASLAKLPRAETVLFAVGFDRRSAMQRSIHDVYAGGAQNVLEALSVSPLTPHPSPLFLYISSTGVYGDADGDWVDESTECRPLREGGRACLAAEQVLANHPLGSRSIVLRPAGIYGPDRIPRADALRRGEPIDAPADGYLNLIHVDDLAQVVLDIERLALAAEVSLPRTFNVADGHPVLRRDYYAELAKLLAAPPPNFATPAVDSPAAQRAAADKRISHARLVREIAPTFTYPSYREGLRAIVQANPA